MQPFVVVVVVAQVVLFSGVICLPQGSRTDSGSKGHDNGKSIVPVHGSTISELPGSQVYIQSSVDPNKEGLVQFLKYMQKIFPFIQVVDKDEYTPLSIWEQFLISLLSETNIRQVDHTDVNGDGQAENDIYMSYTTVKFDPIGNLLNWMVRSVKDFTGFDNMENWWKRVKEDIENYTPYVEETQTEKPEGEDIGGGVVVPVVVPGAISVSKYDPFALGVNTGLFILYNSLFLSAYLPNSGIENILGDDYDDYQDEEEATGEGEEGEGEEDEGEEEGDGEGEGEEGEVEGEAEEPAGAGQEVSDQNTQFDDTQYDQFGNTQYDQFGNTQYDQFGNTQYDQFGNTQYDQFGNQFDPNGGQRRQSYDHYYQRRQARPASKTKNNSAFFRFFNSIYNYFF